MRHFVVALDNSEYALWAFEKAVKMLTEEDNLTLLHAIEIQKTSILDPLHEPLDRLWNIEHRENAKKIQETYSKICAEMNLKNWKFSVIEGDDARSIICTELEVSFSIFFLLWKMKTLLLFFSF